MKKKIYETLLLVLVLISLSCIICWVMYFKEKNSFNLLMSIIVSITVLAVLGKIILIRVVSSKKTQPVVEVPKEPHFKRIVREYEPDLSLVDTPEKAKQNLARCLAIFQSVCDCRGSGVDKYSVEDILEHYKGLSIEAVYRNDQIPDMGIRSRLSVPDVDEVCVYKGFPFHVPVLTTGDHLVPTQEIFDLFVSEFIEEGAVVKFNL